MDIYQLLTDLDEVLSLIEDDPEEAHEKLEYILSELTVLAVTKE